jgi:hypothetical protein
MGKARGTSLDRPAERPSKTADDPPKHHHQPEIHAAEFSVCDVTLPGCLLCVPTAMVNFFLGTLCCATNTLVKFEIPATVIGLEVTEEHARGFDAVGADEVPMCGCCEGTSCAITKLLVCPCLCIPCYYADNAALIDGMGVQSKLTYDCCAFACLALCCMGSLISAPKRTILRHALGIREEAMCGFPKKTCGLVAPESCPDQLTHCCCLPCALVQERKLLEKNQCTREKPAVSRYNDILAAERVVAVQPSEAAASGGEAAERDWCCGRDDNEGFDLCGFVCCGIQ